MPGAEIVCDLITADHKVLSEGCESWNNHVVAQDLATQWIQSYSCETKTLQGNTKELTEVLGADEEATSNLHWQFPRIWQILWRPFVESFYVNTAQIGNWWDCWESSAQNQGRDICGTVAIRSGRKMVDGFHEMLLLSAKLQFNGPVFPFGAMVQYHPISAKDLSRLHQFGPKVLPGIFLRYSLHAVRIWKGDILVADTEELEQMDASELHARRLNAKEVFTPMNGEKFIFPNADGSVKLSGGDQVLRTSTLIRDRTDRGEEQGNVQGESDGSSSSPLQDSSWYDGEARNDFWSISCNIIYRHHVEPGVKLYAPREESFPLSLKIFDVTRTKDTSLDVMLEKNIEDHWNVDGDRELLDAWTSVTKFTFINEKPPDGHAWSWERLTRKQTTSRPHTLWPEIWTDMSDASKRKEKQKVGHRETNPPQCQKTAWYSEYDELLHWSWWWGIQGYHETCS